MQPNLCAEYLVEHFSDFCVSCDIEERYINAVNVDGAAACRRCYLRETGSILAGVDGVVVRVECREVTCYSVGVFFSITGEINETSENIKLVHGSAVVILGNYRNVCACGVLLPSALYEVSSRGKRICNVVNMAENAFRKGRQVRKRNTAGGLVNGRNDTVNLSLCKQ